LARLDHGMVETGSGDAAGVVESGSGHYFALRRLS
jgi:hypothetical protein